MGPNELRSRLRALRAERRELDRAIGALEELQRARLARVVELVPHEMVMECQRLMERARMLQLMA